MQHIVFICRTMCFECEERGDMRSVHGLEFTIIPVGVLSRPVRPLIDAPLYLLTEHRHFNTMKHGVGDGALPMSR